MGKQAQTAENTITAQDIRRLIADRHGLDKLDSRGHEWALFFELRNGTGYGKQERYLDALALNLWPSKKFWRVAYEIKVSRADFLKELEQPEKRAFGREISHEFWFVCAPGVARPEEIPEGCGLMVANKGKLRKVVVARQHEPRSLTDREIAAIARQSCRYNIITNCKWRYGGSELDEAALEELVKARADADMNARIVKLAEERYEKRIKAINTALVNYAAAMRATGVKPPAWMVETDADARYWPNATSEWDARRWVAENISPGPNLKELSKAAEALGTLKNSHGSLRRILEGIEAQARELETHLKDTANRNGAQT